MTGFLLIAVQISITDPLGDPRSTLQCRTVSVDDMLSIEL